MIDSGQHGASAVVRDVGSENGLGEWVPAQARRSAEAMERAISATGLLRTRASFGQSIVPARGSVLASPVIADWNPEPDYFFHWIRDSAIVMRTVAELVEDANDADTRNHWIRHFDDFVRFSGRLLQLDGASCLHGGSPAQRTQPEFRKFLRPDSELRTLTGDRLRGEPRFNPDGTIDIFRWSRPQYDGPALRALACLRFLAAGGGESDALARLLRDDLAFTLRHAAEPCIGPWEEEGESAQHYYVGVVQLAALAHGQGWLDETARQAALTRLRSALERHWSPHEQVYTALLPPKAVAGDDLIDSACLVAVLDADLPGGPHSVDDERVWATLSALEEMFAREFPINRGRAAPALGRSRRDSYFGGGAWYPTTLAAAALCYRRALRDPVRRSEFRARGDAVMATVRDLVPPDGALSEQVDRETGAQTSARHLTWSYAAFVSAARLRALSLRP